MFSLSRREIEEKKTFSLAICGYDRNARRDDMLFLLSALSAESKKTM
jgi:hypothetical protein